MNLAEVWTYRHLAGLLAWRSIRVRYKQTVLGLLWALIGPVAFTVLFVLFFRMVQVQPSADAPYVPSAFAGVILWQFFSRGVSESGVSLTANANLITKVYFPRAALPLAATMAALADFAVTLVLLVVVLLFYGVTPSWYAVFAPLFVVQAFVLVLACGMWLSAIDGLFKDLRHALPLGLQIGMFISPVAYTTAALVPQRWHWLYMMNPMVVPIEGFRWALLGGAERPGFGEVALSALIVFALLVTGTIFFARVERKIVDMV